MKLPKHSVARSTAVLRGIALAALTAGTLAVAGLPAGEVAACSPMEQPRVYVDELSTVLDPNGSWADDFTDVVDFPAPTVTGAYRIEVVAETRETDDSFSGAVWQQTDVWGAAEPAPDPDVRGPVPKDESIGCEGNQPPRGTVWYFLSTEDGVPIPILDTEDGAEVKAALDEVFGPSVAVADSAVSGSPRALMLVAAATGATLLVAAIGIVWVRRRRISP